MRKYVMALLIILSCNTAFADWTKTSDVCLEDIKKTPGEFYLNTSAKTCGVHLIAGDYDENSVVMLRYDNGTINIKVRLFDTLSSTNDHHICLQFLDADRYFLAEQDISTVHAGYTGEIFGNYTMRWDLFNKVKYYRIAIRY